MTIDAGMAYGDGYTLEQQVSLTVTTERVPSYIGFGHDGKYYFPRRSGLELPLEVRGVRKARIGLYRMFPSNIAVAVRDINDGEPWYQFLESWSDR